MVAVQLVACGDGGGKQVTAGEIKVEAGEFYFKPNSFTVEQNAPVRFMVTNAGKIEHSLVFEGIEARIQSIMPGTMNTLEIIFSDSGAFTFICDIPGHAGAGMKGKVTVERTTGQQGY